MKISCSWAGELIDSDKGENKMIQRRTIGMTFSCLTKPFKEEKKDKQSRRDKAKGP